MILLDIVSNSSPWPTLNIKRQVYANISVANIAVAICHQMPIHLETITIHKTIALYLFVGKINKRCSWSFPQIDLSAAKPIRCILETFDKRHKIQMAKYKYRNYSYFFQMKAGQMQILQSFSWWKTQKILYANPHHLVVVGNLLNKLSKADWRRPLFYNQKFSTAP